jgi:membrane-associated phospholipid phosphatase
MRSGILQRERDYNRALPRAVRAARLPVAVAASAWRRVWVWASEDERAWWARWLVLGILGVAVLLPLDGVIRSGAGWAGAQLGGDLRRELEVIQQYGAITSLLLIAFVIWVQDPLRRAHLADFAAAIAATGLVVLLVKGLVGRVRPRDAMLVDYNHWSFLGPFGAVPGKPGDGVLHSWQFGAGDVSNIQSMPSSHMAYAVATSVFLIAMYPKLRALVIVLPIIVGLCRITFGAHWASDVVAGAAVGAIASQAVVRSRLGQRIATRIRAMLGVEGLDPAAAPRV